MGMKFSENESSFLNNNSKNKDNKTYKQENIKKESMNETNTKNGLNDKINVIDNNNNIDNNINVINDNINFKNLIENNTNKLKNSIIDKNKINDKNKSMNEKLKKRRRRKNKYEDNLEAKKRKYTKRLPKETKVVENTYESQIKNIFGQREKIMNEIFTEQLLLTNYNIDLYLNNSKFQEFLLSYHIFDNLSYEDNLFLESNDKNIFEETQKVLNKAKETFVDKNITNDNLIINLLSTEEKKYFFNSLQKKVVEKVPKIPKFKRNLNRKRKCKINISTIRKKPGFRISKIRRWFLKNI